MKDHKMNVIVLQSYLLNIIKCDMTFNKLLEKKELMHKTDKYQQVTD